MKQTTHYERISTMLTTGEVARLLNVHDSTVRRWNDRGIIKAYRIGPRGERRFRRDDIAIFFLDRAVQKFVQE
jgi:excisionase family DNA binding protein